MANSTDSLQTLIVGAGLTGLVLAKRLLDSKQRVSLIEKSKGVGGRMATRRTDTARFDHGAQFYTLQETIKDIHEQWLQESLVNEWFTVDNKFYFKSANGMTALAKNLARGLNIDFEKRLASLARHGDRWKLKLESGDEIESDRVVLTAPLPQSLEILRVSDIDFDPALAKIGYAKAVVALIEVETMSTSMAGPNGYLEPKGPLLFSISDQKLKGLSTTPSLTVTLNADSSETLYDQTDAQIIDVISNELRRLDPDFRASSIQIKKWRYSHPLSRFEKPYVIAAPDLYLAGDAFGGPSLNGAVRSANALAEKLLWRPN